jgi:hypothetical protein
MNVTASKLLLVVSLAAYAWMCWGHLTYSHPAPETQKPGKEITAAMVDHPVHLALAGDPFGSTPLDRSAVAGGGGGAGGVLPVDPSKKLGELTLQGVFISVGQRVAVINGKTMHEGEIVESAPGGPMIRAKQIGQDHVIIEGGGGVMLLRLADANKSDKSDDAAAKPPGTGTGTAGLRSPAQARGPGRAVASLRTEER